MKITFLGTRGYIDPSSKTHKYYTSTMISYKNTDVMIDCGENWFKKMPSLSPDFIVLTHAHPDHAFGLKKGASCPVYATKTCWKGLKNFPLQKKYVMPLRKKIKLGAISFEAFPVLHSIICPAVGYRIQAGKKKIFYVPDVAWIKNMKTAFKDILLYIGDGATIFRNMIRKSKKSNQIFGHATIRQQLTWCHKYKVPKMIITHCGSDIVKNERKAKKIIYTLAEERNVEVAIAYNQEQLLL